MQKHTHKLKAGERRVLTILKWGKQHREVCEKKKNMTDNYHFPSLTILSWDMLGKYKGHENSISG